MLFRNFFKKIKKAGYSYNENTVKDIFELVSLEFEKEFHLLRRELNKHKKQCTKCKEEKSYSEFSLKTNQGAYYFQSQCKQCLRRNSRKNHKSSPRPKLTEEQKKQKISEYQKKYWEKRGKYLREERSKTKEYKEAEKIRNKNTYLKRKEKKLKEQEKLKKKIQKSSSSKKTVEKLNDIFNELTDIKVDMHKTNIKKKLDDIEFERQLKKDLDDYYE